MTQFVDFVLTSGSPKLTKVREMREQDGDDYSPATDFWKPLREGFVEHHRSGAERQALDQLALRADAKRQARYRECVGGHKKFIGRKQIVYFQPPRDAWEPVGIDAGVRVNPELGLEIDGVRHVVKLYFKAVPLTKRKAEMLLLLMAETLKVDEGTRYAILDVPRSKLFAETSPDRTLLPLLLGEAAGLYTMWKNLG